MTFECCLWALLPVGVALLLWGEAWYDRYESLSEGAMKRYLLQLLHNAVAHPVLGVLGYPAPAWAVRFHDWTAELAWPGHLKYVNETEKYDVPEPQEGEDSFASLLLAEIHKAGLPSGPAYTYTPGPHGCYPTPAIAVQPDEVIVTYANPAPAPEGEVTR